jgi:hypothetical protein
MLEEALSQKLDREKDAAASHHGSEEGGPHDERVHSFIFGVALALRLSPAPTVKSEVEPVRCQKSHVLDRKAKARK